MPFAAAISRHPDTASALGEVVGQLFETVSPESGVDVAVVFFTRHHHGAAHDLARSLHDLLRPAALIGASAVGVLAAGEGAEDEPGLSVWVAQLGAEVAAVVRFEDEADLAQALPPSPASGPAWVQDGTLLLVADPFSFPVGEAVRTWGAEYPGLQVVGGLASAGSQPGSNILMAGSYGSGIGVHHHGAVGLLLDPHVVAGTVVSQGCRPIGRPWVVTAAERHVLIELGGRPALERVAETLQALDPAEQALAAQGLHCGIVVDEHLVEFERGDFLIRGVLAADRERRTVTVGDVVNVGSTVQFQVRDASTATEDLEVMLRRTVEAANAQAAIVFTCNGRGAFMFGDAHHDAAVVGDLVGSAVAGMFCAGEIGPVAGRPALHGFTASVALLHDPGTVAT